MLGLSRLAAGQLLVNVARRHQCGCIRYLIPYTIYTSYSNIKYVILRLILLCVDHNNNN